jgi:hypothetical protein
MARIMAIIRAVHSGEEGHAPPLVPALLGAAGAIVLAVGAAEDSSATAYIGGIGLGVGLLGMLVVHHLTIEYGIFKRLDDLEE